MDPVAPSSTLPWLGEILSSLAPLAWAVAVILFRVAGDRVGPLSLNLFKNTAGLVLMLPLVAVAGAADWRGVSALDLALLLTSGVVGIAVADTLFLWALNRLGAARIAVVEAAYPVATILLSFAFLGERFGWLQWAGASLVVAAIVLGAWGQEEPSPRGAEPAPTAVALGAGVASVVLMGVGIVMVKPVLDHLSVVGASAARLAGGQVALLAWCGIHRRRRALFSVFRPSGVWRVIVPGAVIGTFLAYMLWVGGMKYAPVSVASVLNQLHVVYIAVLAALFLDERLTPARWLAVVLGLVGSAVVAVG